MVDALVSLGHLFEVNSALLGLWALHLLWNGWVSFLVEYLILIYMNRFALMEEKKKDYFLWVRCLFIIFLLYAR